MQEEALLTERLLKDDRPANAPHNINDNDVCGNQDSCADYSSAANQNTIEVNKESVSKRDIQINQEEASYIDERAMSRNTNATPIMQRTFDLDMANGMTQKCLHQNLKIYEVPMCDDNATETNMTEVDQSPRLRIGSIDLRQGSYRAVQLNIDSRKNSTVLESKNVTNIHHHVQSNKEDDDNCSQVTQTDLRHAIKKGELDISQMQGLSSQLNNHNVGGGQHEQPLDEPESEVPTEQDRLTIEHQTIISQLNGQTIDTEVAADCQLRQHIGRLASAESSSDLVSGRQPEPEAPSSLQNHKQQIKELQTNIVYRELDDNQRESSLRDSMMQDQSSIVQDDGNDQVSDDNEEQQLADGDEDDDDVSYDDEDDEILDDDDDGQHSSDDKNHSGIVARSSPRGTGQDDSIILETLSEAQAFDMATGSNVLEKSMQALCLMHKLDQESCLKVEGEDATSFQSNNKLRTVWQMYKNPLNFVRKSPFWSMSKKNQQLSKVIMHSNEVVYEPGGREIRSHDHNTRFNYKQVQAEGELHLSVEEQKLLNMQPNNYTIYMRNLAQTVSRNLAGVDEVITGLDTVWAGGRNATQNYLNQRYTIPKVRKDLCQGLVSKQDNNAYSLIEKALIKVTHKALVSCPDQAISLQQHEFQSTLPGGAGVGGQRGASKTKKQQNDRIHNIDLILRDASEQSQQKQQRSKPKQYGRIGSIKPQSEEADCQSVVSKNKFYGKILDRSVDQWVYFERYLNTVNVRVMQGCLQSQAELQEEMEQHLRSEFEKELAAGSFSVGTPSSFQVTPDLQKIMGSHHNMMSGPYSHHAKMLHGKASLDSQGGYHHHHISRDQQQIYNTISMNQMRRKQMSDDSCKDQQSNQLLSSDNNNCNVLTSPFMAKNSQAKIMHSAQTSAKQKYIMLKSAAGGSAAKVKHQLAHGGAGSYDRDGGKHDLSIESQQHIGQRIANQSVKEDLTNVQIDQAKALSSCINKTSQFSRSRDRLGGRGVVQAATAPRSTQNSVPVSSSHHNKNSVTKISSKPANNETAKSSITSQQQQSQNSPPPAIESKTSIPTIKSSNATRTAPLSYKSSMKEAAILKDVVKVVAGSSGNVEHIHEDYWEPISPGKLTTLRKPIKRVMKKVMLTPVASHHNGFSRVSTAGQGGDVLEREINSFDMKHMFKVTREVMRKNMYKHMHQKPTDQTTKNSQQEKQQSNDLRKNEAKSELQVRENTQAKTAARTILSSNDYQRSNRQQRHVNASESSQFYCGERQLADVDSSEFTTSRAEVSGVYNVESGKPHAKTANEVLGQSAWKTGNIEEQIRIRIHKEGKSYTRKVKIDTGKKVQPVLKKPESAFTAQYNATKNVMNSTATNMNKSGFKDHSAKHNQMLNIYNEKLPPLLADKQSSNRLAKQKAVSQGAVYKKRENQESRQRLQQPGVSGIYSNQKAQAGLDGLSTTDNTTTTNTFGQPRNTLQSPSRHLSIAENKKRLDSQHLSVTNNSEVVIIIRPTPYERVSRRKQHRKESQPINMQQQQMIRTGGDSSHINESSLSPRGSIELIDRIKMNEYRIINQMNEISSLEKKLAGKQQSIENNNQQYDQVAQNIVQNYERSPGVAQQQQQQQQMQQQVTMKKQQRRNIRQYRA